MLLLSPILFYSPDVHLKSLDKIWVDKIVAKGPWVKLINKLTSEWADHTTFATILLNANVAFLQVLNAPSSLARIFSYISTVLVIGSIIIGLMLGRHHRTKHIGTAVEAALFLDAHDLQTTAIIYSLPYALLMYGMIFFLTAFLFACFWSTSITTRLSVGICWAIISMLIVWTLVWQSPGECTTWVASWLGHIESGMRWINSCLKAATGGDNPDESTEVGPGRIPSAGTNREDSDIDQLQMTNLGLIASSSLNTAETIV